MSAPAARTQERVTTPNGSVWVVAQTEPQYGRAAPAGREFWAQRVSGQSPAHLQGIAGFYGRSWAGVLARVGGVAS